MAETTGLRPAVFLDRDGTIADELGYLNHARRFRIFPYAAAAIRRLNDAGLVVVVITNQSGIGRGYFPESLVAEVHSLMKQQLAAGGARVDAVYYCPHTSSVNCDCRKPKPGMLELAEREHGLDVARSFVVGDRYSDIEVAHRVSARGILVRTGYGAGEEQWHLPKWPFKPEVVVDSLTEAVDWILRQPK